MSKSNKVAVAVSKSVNPTLAASILAKCDAVGAQAFEVQISTAKATESFRAVFADLCIAAGVPMVKVGEAVQFDRKSEVGQALDKVLRDRIVEAAKKSPHYDVAVHRVGDKDEYLPVSIWNSVKRCFEPVAGRVANYKFTAAFALGVDLKALPNVIEAPNGSKAWLRGNAAGCRPDGRAMGLRDSINNDIDQSLSRGWRMDQSGKRAGGNRGDFADALNGLYKLTAKKRDRWAKENNGDAVVSDDQWKSLCALIQTLAFDSDLFDAVYQAADDLAK